ncbi:MAG: fatty acid desaturase [Bacteroidales bacterium]|nr:fatty acid desaturase [Bacteroidales bacterium]
MPPINPSSASPSWQAIITRYNNPRMSSSIWQMINSIIPYLLLWVLMIYTLNISFWLTLPITILAAGFLTRIFIIFHDCGHGSFFRSRKLNFIIGSVCGIFAFTPYHSWTDSHRAHHQTVGNLDKRGMGDVWTYTVREYKALSPMKRLGYRLYRHPLVLLGIGGLFKFVISNRFTTRRMTWKQRLNIYFTNTIWAIIFAGMHLLIGWKAFLLIQLPVIYFASIGGVFLFYLQHQFDEVIWCRQEDWDYKTMAMDGSSFFKLPAILQWFTGNIGFHHVHHLGPTIPNYKLAKCHRENEIFRDIKPITLIESFKSLKIRFWDEDQQRVVSLGDLRN